MQIRRAGTQDIEGVGKLLVQVNMVHHNGRPDLFNGPAQKYDSKQLQEIFADDNRPVFVAVDEQDHVMGYAFCILQRHCQDAILTDIQTLYIDDLVWMKIFAGSISGSSSISMCFPMQKKMPATM